MEAKCLLYAINGGRDEITGQQVGPEFTPITSEYLDYDEVMKKYLDNTIIKNKPKMILMCNYEPKSKFGGIQGLRKQQANDMKKREYCKAHNITLIAIPYWDEERITFDYIMKAAGY